VQEPVGDQEGLVLREVAVVEHKEELAALLQSLNRVRDACGEAPEVALADVDEVAALRIDGRDASPPRDHVGPLGLFVPVHLADAARFQPHVHAGQRGGDGQLASCHLAGPPAAEKAVPSCGEGELEVRDGAGVRVG
jgi:hypothetical protein